MSVWRVSDTPLRRMAAALYRVAVNLRNWAYDRSLFKVYHSRLPVISVGNIVVGGSGKSPVSRFIAETLLELGRRPVIVSRGYAGSVVGPHLVSDSDNAQAVGDEPLMQRRHFADSCAVVVAKQRAAGAKMAEEKKLGEVLILDDGFQHRALDRDLNLLLLDISEQNLNEVLSQPLLPAGELREDPKQAVDRATAFILVKRLLQSGEFQLPELNKPTFGAALFPAAVRDAVSKEVREIGFLSGKKGAVVSAIAHPHRFSSMLKELGVVVEREMFFADHSSLPEQVLLELAAGGTSLFLTEKDAVKLKTNSFKAGQLYVLELGCNIFPREQFLSYLRSNIS